ncbi:hypothetical protein BDV12DRAFT_192612 [Aspergillus spectabilis]
MAESYQFHEILVNSSLTMSALLELILFNERTWPFRWGTSELAWWDTTRREWKSVEQLRGERMYADLVIEPPASATCHDSDIEEAEDREDMVLMERVRNAYKEAGMKMCLVPEEPRVNEWSDSRWYD